MNPFFEENQNRSDLGRQAVRSGLVAMLARAITGVIRIGGTLFLARLLLPEDWGLVAIVLALTSFAPMLIDLGLGDATVQRAKITPAHISALFWMNLGLALVIALLLVGVSPLIASIYREPRLEGITSAVAITFVLSSLSLQHLSLLRRTMRFNDIAVIEIVGALGGAGVGIAMAVWGGGYWALVVRPIVAALITAAGAWLRCDWRPSFPRIDGEVKSMVKFGANISGGAVAVLISNAVDRAALGLIYPARLVGFYQTSLMIFQNAVTGISGPLQAVGVSALSRLQDDPALLRKKYTTALSTVCFYSMPAFATLAVIGPDLVPWLLGENWEPAGDILRIFALGGILYIIEASQNWLHLPLGRADRMVRWTIVTALVQATAVLAGLPFGVEGVAAAIVLGRGALAIPSVIYAGRPIDIGARTVLGAVGKQLSGAILILFAGSAVMYLLLEDAGRLSRIAMAAGVCLVTYLSLVVGVLALRTPLRSAFSLTKRFAPERFHP